MFTDAEKINTKGYFENQNGCLKEIINLEIYYGWIHEKLNLLSILLDLDRLTFFYIIILIPSETE